MQRTLKTRFAFIVFAILLITPFANSAHAQNGVLTVHIKADGFVEPAYAPIERLGDIYCLTDDIEGLIIIEKSNVVLDGAGFTLHGTYDGTLPEGWMIGQGPPSESENTSLWTIGIDLFPATKPNNITIRNIIVKGFYVGMYLWTENNTVVDNSVTGNVVGILLSGDNGTISKNYIAYNYEGLFLGLNNPGELPFDVALSRNSFVNNSVQLSGCTCPEYNITEPLHTWDDGSIGNFWSDYQGVDTNGDGMGDSPYVIDQNNQDRFPLMQIYSTPSPTPKATIKPEDLPFSVVVELFVLTALAAILVIVTILLSKRKKTESQKTSG